MLHYLCCQLVLSLSCLYEPQPCLRPPLLEVPPPPAASRQDRRPSTMICPLLTRTKPQTPLQQWSVAPFALHMLFSLSFLISYRHDSSFGRCQVPGCYRFSTCETHRKGKVRFRAAGQLQVAQQGYMVQLSVSPKPRALPMPLPHLQLKVPLNTSAGLSGEQTAAPAISDQG